MLRKKGYKVFVLEGGVEKYFSGNNLNIKRKFNLLESSRK